MESRVSLVFWSLGSLKRWTLYTRHPALDITRSLSTRWEHDPGKCPARACAVLTPTHPPGAGVLLWWWTENSSVNTQPEWTVATHWPCLQKPVVSPSVMKVWQKLNNFWVLGCGRRWAGRLRGTSATPSRTAAAIHHHSWPVLLWLILFDIISD